MCYRKNDNSKDHYEIGFDLGQRFFFFEVIFKAKAKLMMLMPNDKCDNSKQKIFNGDWLFFATVQFWAWIQIKITVLS